MERDEIRQVLNIPDRPFVDYMIGLANLRPKEAAAVHLREMDDLTIFEAAEAMNLSETMIKTYHRQGFKKLDQCWSSRPWIDAARRQYFPPQ